MLIKLFLLIITSTLVFAGQDQSIQSALNDLAEIKSSNFVRHNPCSEMINRNSNKLIVLFDGRTSYRKKFLESYKSVESHGLLSLLKKVYVAGIKNDWSKVSSSEKELFKSFHNTAEGIGAIRSLLIAYPDSFSQFDVLYFPQRGYRKSLKCIKMIHQKNEYSSIDIIGYSNGSVAASVIASKLWEENFPTRKLLTVDSVGKGFRIFKNLLSNKNSNFPFFNRNSVEYWLNFYQKDDRKTMLLGVKGNSSPDADVNIKVKTDENGHKMFNFIYLNDEYRALIQTFLIN